jgi:carboxylesterase
MDPLLRILRPLARLLLLVGLAFACVERAGRRAALLSLRRERDPRTGILLGAEPVKIARGRGRACLLLHGWLTSPADFGRLPHALDQAGWDVYAPLLPGHGTIPHDLARVTADDLLGAARRDYALLRTRYGRVSVVGFSMGGSIAAVLSADHPPHKLVLVAPFFAARYRWRYVLPPRWWARLLGAMVEWADRGPAPTAVNGPGGAEGIVMYRAVPASAGRALFELRRRALRVRPAGGGAGTLLVYSRGDELASPPAMERFLARLDGPKRRAVFERSNHHLFHDWDREEATSAVLGFLGGSRALARIGWFAAPGRPEYNRWMVGQSAP